MGYFFNHVTFVTSSPPRSVRGSRRLFLLSKYLSYEAKEQPIYPFSRFIDKRGLLVLTDITVLLTRCVLFYNLT